MKQYKNNDLIIKIYLKSSIFVKKRPHKNKKKNNFENTEYIYELDMINTKWEYIIYTCLNLNFLTYHDLTI